MEYEDALQELYVALLESLNYLDASCPEGKCVKYMEKAIVNRYYALCKRCLSQPDMDSTDDAETELPAASAYDDSRMDVEAYISSLPDTGFRRQILSMFFYRDMADKDIAAELGVSRQYVNRVKKQLVRAYFSDRTKFPR